MVHEKMFNLIWMAINIFKRQHTLFQYFGANKNKWKCLKSTLPHILHIKHTSQYLTLSVMGNSGSFQLQKI